MLNVTRAVEGTRQSEKLFQNFSSVFKLFFCFSSKKFKVFPRSTPKSSRKLHMFHTIHDSLSFFLLCTADLLLFIYVNSQKRYQYEKM